MPPPSCVCLSVGTPPACSPHRCYGVSKMGVIALTRVLARDEPTILVNSADPGYCATDQNADQV